MSQEQSKDAHEYENREAEKLAQELESPLGAQKLGDEAYELVKKELAKKGKQP
ncbi:MAG: hypothetical protein JKY67_17115 [Pseudomonadales bacterium]|nr:hypothetical protein [Pseudomonadales bacterium]